MAGVHCLEMVLLARGKFQPARGSVRDLRTVLFAATLFLLGLATIFACDAKAAQSAIGYTQSVSATGVSTPDDDRQLICPICGRPVCTIPDDALATSPPGSALAQADTALTPVPGSVRVPLVRARDAPFATFFASFEPRGPPFDN